MILEFFEKVGCKNNGKQKELLAKAGVQLECRDLLQYPFTAGELLPFFKDLPVSGWFNLAAPQIKQGLLDPTRFDAKEAVALMLNNPILIRRPLLRQGERHLAGFDPGRVEEVFGIPLGRVAGEPSAQAFQREFVDCGETHKCPPH